ARTAEQIKQEYNRGAAVLGSRSNNIFMSDGLVGYWKMDESNWNGTSGEVKDSSGNGNHGTTVNGAVTGAGKFGNGGSFDGSNQVNVQDNVIFDNTNSLTISFWVHFNGAQDNNDHIVSKGGAGAGSSASWQ